MCNTCLHCSNQFGTARKLIPYLYALVMSRQLRLYRHPLLSVTQHFFENSDGVSPDKFLRYIPKNVNPFTHIIVPQTTGLNPNAHLTPLKGYKLLIKGKLMEKTLRSNRFSFRTGITRKSDYHGHHFEEGYTVLGPYGSIGIKVYYEYDLRDYFTSNQLYTPNDNEQQKEKLQPQTKQTEIPQTHQQRIKDRKEFDDSEVPFDADDENVNTDFHMNMDFDMDMDMDMDDDLYSDSQRIM